MLKHFIDTPNRRRGIRLASITKTIQQLEHLNSLYKEDNFTKHIQDKIKKLKKLYKELRYNG